MQSELDPEVRLSERTPGFLNNGDSMNVLLLEGFVLGGCKKKKQSAGDPFPSPTPTSRL